MVWVRGVIFTLLVPFMLGIVVPQSIAGDVPAAPNLLVRLVGYTLVIVGVAFYLLSLLRFLAVGGTPSIYFLHSLRGLLGEEPRVVVQSGLYGLTRNPMYVGVLTAIQGQALLAASWPVAIYGVLFGLWLHVVVRRIEEPHLRRDRGVAYDEYCRRVPRWLIR